MTLFYIFLIILVGAHGEELPARVHVLSGVFTKPVPDTVITYEDTTSILFKVKFDFTPPQNYFIQDLRDHCPPDFGRGSLSPICMMGPYVTGNFQAVTNRLNLMCQSLTALKPIIPHMETISTVISKNKRYPEYHPVQINPVLTEDLDLSQETKNEFITTQTTTTPKPLVQGDPSDPRTRFQIEHDELVRRTLMQTRPPLNQMQIHIPPPTTALPPPPTLTRRLPDFEILRRQAALAALAVGWNSIDINSRNAIRLANTITNQNHMIGSGFLNISSYLGTRIKQNNKIEDMQKSMQEGALRSFLFQARMSEDIYRSLELFQYASIQSACMTGRLSLQAVDYVTLNQELLTLRTILNKNNMTLVIPQERLSSYYHYELTRCSFKPEQGIIEIQLNIPIKPLHEQVDITEIFSIPFFHKTDLGEPQICFVQHSHDFVILKNDMPFPISMADTSHCRISDGICQYFSLATRATSHAGCVKALLAPQGTRFDVLHQACPFSCRLTNSAEVLVTKLGWHNSLFRYAITQPPLNSEIICNNNSTLRNFELLQPNTTSPYGVIIVEIPCSCYINLNDKHSTVVPPFPCLNGQTDKNTFKTPQLNLIIPSRWSKINVAELTKANNYNQKLYLTEGYSNLSDIYNEKWFEKDIVLNLTQPGVRDFNSFQQYVLDYHHLFNPAIITVWMGFLSLFAIFLYYKTWKLSQQLFAFAMFIPGAKAENLSIIQHNVVLFVITIIILISLILFLIFLCCGLYCKQRTSTQSLSYPRGIEGEFQTFHISTPETPPSLDPKDIFAGYITVR
ncbi:hypothetical protein Fcan01_16151 [Folsomia candida]|uniref:Uncharacterized protein n=1 Tax=Folsomia candida TaxID=158441 RepID=A0A226DVY0_FOLCA|nr:hypothetical protein Fcan01_16151 [Folsomia candida]